MKIIISGYFDAGFSIGIDDYPFSSREMISKLCSDTGYAITYNQPRENFAYADEELREKTYSTDDSEGHIGISVPIGSGLRINLAGSHLLTQLHEEAMQAAANPEFMGVYYPDPPLGIVEKIEQFRQQVSFKHATVHLYGLGIGYIYLESEELNEDLQDMALWIYRCYEYASYGTFSDGRFCDTFRRLVSKIFLFFSGSDNIAEITRRKIPCDFFPGYQLILMCTREQDAVLAGAILKDYDELTPIQMDDGVISLGWAAAIVEPSNKDYVSRILYLLKMAQVYYGICDGFERLFAHHISESVRESLTSKGSDYDAFSLNRLRTIAHTVAEFTRFGALTQNISDLKLLKAFDQLGGFSAKIEHMASACEIFTNIQNEVLEQKQAKRDKRLNVYAMALTALTFVSVTADMMSINDALYIKGWTILLKLGAIQVMVILIIYMAFEGRKTRKRK